jgi:hypothetical protein
VLFEYMREITVERNCLYVKHVVTLHFLQWLYKTYRDSPWEECLTLE